MYRFAVSLLLFAVCLVAGDLSGKWSGSAVAGSQSERSHPVYLVLNQDGSKVTGTVGRDEFEQVPISNTKLEGDTLTFEIPTGEVSYNVTLKLESDSLLGEASRERGGQKVVTKISLKRVTPAR